MKDSLEIAGRIHPKMVQRTAARSRIILVGARRDARKLLYHLDKASRREMTIVGFVDAGHHKLSKPRSRGRHLPLHPQSAPVPVLGGLDNLSELVNRTGATDLIVAVPEKPRRHLLPGMAKFTNSDVTVHWVPVDTQHLELDALPTKARRIDPVLRAEAVPPAAAGEWSLDSTPLSRRAKRLSDILISGLALLVLSPILVAVAIAILLTTGRPIFYTQERVGHGGRRFRIIKFRSMRTDAESETGPIWASNHDSRCTRIGDWLRHTNIDEIPQLFNVLKGEMSLVGPRPERPIFVEQFQDAIPEYDLRHAVPCGMTGWAQVHGWRGRTSLRKRIQYDLDYIQRWSFGLDFIIMLMTIQHVAWGKTTWKMSRPRRKLEA